jgi:hypothetical protein
MLISTFHPSNNIWHCLNPTYLFRTFIPTGHWSESDTKDTNACLHPTHPIIDGFVTPCLLQSIQICSIVRIYHLPYMFVISIPSGTDRVENRRILTYVPMTLWNAWNLACKDVMQTLPRYLFVSCYLQEGNNVFTIYIGYIYFISERLSWKPSDTIVCSHELVECITPCLKYNYYPYTCVCNTIDKRATMYKSH